MPELWPPFRFTLAHADPRMTITPDLPAGSSWIDELSDEQCMEIFWLYVEPPEEFLRSHSARLLGAAMRYALHVILEDGARASGRS